MKRLFVAINIPKNIKQQIKSKAYKLEDIFKNDKNIRFIDPENWHLTVSFLGYQPIEAMGPILNSLKKTSKNFQAFKIDFDKIILGPPNKPARMIWLVTSKETSLAIEKIKTDLENNLAENGVKFIFEKRKYNGHITLARSSGIIENHKKMPTCDKLDLSFVAQSIDLMESRLERNGAQYEILSASLLKINI